MSGAMSDVIIRAEGLGKSYRLHHQRRQRYVALRDVLAEKAWSLGRWVAGRGSAPDGEEEEERPARRAGQQVVV